MSVTVTVDAERRELFVLAEGVVTLEVIRAHLLQEYADGALGYRELIDARGARVAITSSDVREVVLLVRAAARTGRLGPTAVVVADDDALGLLRTMGTMLDDVAALRAFRDFAAAVDWLTTAPMSTERADRRAPDPLVWH